MRWTRRASEETSAEGDDRKGGGLIRFMVTVAILAWALRSFIVAPFNIPSGSMLPALYVGDYLLVAKWPYGYSRVSFPLGIPSFDGRIFSDLPERGDVAVFRHPTENSDLIKRVIALPGDRIAVSGGAVILNGRRLQREQAGRFAMPISPNSDCKVVPPATAFVQNRDGRSYCLFPALRETLPDGTSYTVLDQIDTARADEFPEVTVPEGHVFMMGDNRDDSLDSRYSTMEGGVGFVPVENLAGRALVTFWSTDGSAVYWKPWTWFSALRGDRIGNGYYGPPE